MRKRPGHESKIVVCGGRRLSSLGPAVAANCSYRFAMLEDLSSRIQGLIFGDVLGDVGTFGIGPTGEDDESRLVVCVCA